MTPTTARKWQGATSILQAASVILRLLISRRPTQTPFTWSVHSRSDGGVRAKQIRRKGELLCVHSVHVAMIG